MADWSTWGGNSDHSFYSSQDLPANLRLNWTRQLHQPSAAWPLSQTKLRFDDAPGLVVAGGLLLVNSTVTDSVTAYSLKGSTQKWTFKTNGPVRLNPAVDGGRVYFGSDDGYLYCLDLKTGKELWRLHGGPDDRRILGNERLINMWPVRGAPVVKDGVVYFSAGIWPFMGIFIHAVNAKTGVPIWTNSSNGSKYIVQQHGSPAFAGVAPQGYLAVSGDVLLVPGGRSVPAAFDRKTGKFLYFHISSRQFGKSAGGYGIKTTEKSFVNGYACYNSKDGSGLMPHEVSIIEGNTFYSLEKNELFAFKDIPEKKEVTDRRGKKRISGERVTIWKKTVTFQKLICKSAKNFIGLSADNELMIYDSVSNKVTWTHKLKEPVREVICSDGRIVASTTSGKIYCFGSSVDKSKDYALTVKHSPKARDVVVDIALKHLKRKSNAYGLLVQPDSIDVVSALIASTDLFVVVLESDRKRVEKLRSVFAPQQVHVIHGELSKLSLPAYFADLVICGKRSTLVSDRSIAKNIINSIRPYGGIALAPLSLEKEFSKALSVNEKLSKESSALLIRRSGALKGAANWGHQNADPGNSLTSKDTLVKLPLGLLWFGGPSNDDVLPRHGHGPSPQVVNGRLYIEGPDMLRAVDIYTGRRLWQANIPKVGKYYDNTSHHPGANEIGSNYACTTDAVYVFRPEYCLKLNAETGKEEDRFKLPNGAKWGSLVIVGDKLVVSGSPMYIPSSEGGKSKKKKNKKSKASANSVPLIPENSKWQYLAGKDAQTGWTSAGFKATGWKNGVSGFGYSDNDDKTVLKGMRGTYSRVYIRREFQAKTSKLKALQLNVSFDDAFVAYLNGKEICRVGVKGSGAKANKVTSHEADGFETFEIPLKFLKDGRNILCLEGHNVSAKSSDFTLDVALAAEALGKVVAVKKEAVEKETVAPEITAVDGVVENADYSSASRMLYVLDRHSGKVVWKRPASYSYRHNSIIAAEGKVFCIDSLSDGKKKFLQRRGVQLTKKPALYALSLNDGSLVWKEEVSVFGTWLSYSTKHKLLFQGSSINRDRAKDEAKQGMAVYKAADGNVLWKNDAKYGGPVMLHHEKIITQGNAYNLLDGKQITRVNPITGERENWSFSRGYGCNTAICSENLLTFRSAAAGYYDLANDGGTGNIGGFKSSCTSNLIAAGGLLNAPDYTRTCSCSYQNQTSLALVYMPDVEMWTFNRLGSGDVKRLGINLGANGDRKAADGTLWLEWPVVGGSSPSISVTVEPKSYELFNRHSASLEGSHGLKWVAASGIKQLKKLSIALRAKGEYTVKLVFPKSAKKTFSVKLNGKTVLDNYSPSSEASTTGTVVRTFKGIRIDRKLSIEFSGQGLLSGLELLKE